MTWQWSASASQYRDSETGRFLSRDRALEFVQESITATENVSDTLASFVAGDTPSISPTDWLTAMRQDIKDEYIRQYLLGKGGREQMESTDWGSIGGMLAEQYGKLDGFYQEILTGELSEAQVRARSRMYIRSGREGYERAQERVQLAAGANEVRWVINALIENCVDCIAFENLGWQLVESDPYDGCMPGSGCTVCLTNCGCDREWRTVEEEQ